MRRFLILAMLSVAAFAQSGPINLGFEEGDPAGVSPGWFGPKSMKEPARKPAAAKIGCPTK